MYTARAITCPNITCWVGGVLHPVLSWTGGRYPILSYSDMAEAPTERPVTIGSIMRWSWVTPSVNGQTSVKILPSPILWMRAVKNRF